MRFSIKSSFVALAIAISMFLSIRPTSAKFNDVPDIYPYSKSIDWAFENGIVSGYEGNKFMPNKSISRQEFTKIVIGAKYSKDEIENCKEQYFIDIDSTNAFFNYICLAKRNSIISGFSDKTFKPENLISFAESAKILSNTFLDTAGKKTYPEDTWQIYLDALANPDSAQFFIPPTIQGLDYKITRGETTEVICRIKEHNKSGVETHCFNNEMGLDRLFYNKRREYRNIVFHEEMYMFNFDFSNGPTKAKINLTKIDRDGNVGILKENFSGFFLGLINDKLYLSMNKDNSLETSGAYPSYDFYSITAVGELQHELKSDITCLRDQGSTGCFENNIFPTIISNTLYFLAEDTSTYTESTNIRNISLYSYDTLNDQIKVIYNFDSASDETNSKFYIYEDKIFIFDNEPILSNGAEIGIKYKILQLNMNGSNQELVSEFESSNQIGDGMGENFYSSSSVFAYNSIYIIEHALDQDESDAVVSIFDVRLRKINLDDKTTKFINIGKSQEDMDIEMIGDSVYLVNHPAFRDRSHRLNEDDTLTRL